MKKGLLFVLSMGLFISSFGQTAKYEAHEQQAPKNELGIEPQSSTQPIQLQNLTTSNKGTVNAIQIGSSANVYSLLVEQQSCLSADQATGALIFTHRGNPNAGLGANSGDIFVSKSVDGGTTWSNYQVTSGSLNRYPGGVFYNPTGNTNPDNAYAVFVGPTTGGSGWTDNYFGSVKLDSTNIDVDYLPALPNQLVRMNLVGIDDKFHVVGVSYDDVAYVNHEISIYNGVFNTTNNNVDWTKDEIVPSFANASDGSDAGFYWKSGAAWSPDGMTGYVYTIGRDSIDDNLQYQPIIWKSIDAGVNWTKMPVFDFSTVTAITNEIPGLQVDETIKKPYFSSSTDAVVDANGDLHFFSKVRGHSTMHPDSSGYRWLPRVGGDALMHVYMTSTGWDAELAARIYTKEVDADESGYGAGNDAQGWDSRIQASRTEDGTKIFVTYTDTDTNIAEVSADNYRLNTYPDLFVWGKDVVTGKYTGNLNLTAGTTAEQQAYYHYSSDIVLFNGTDYTMPLTVALFDPFGQTPLEPVPHYYLEGIEFDDNDFVTNPGIDENNSVISALSQNYPNPFRGETSFSFELAKPSKVTIDVYNLMGQQVMNIEKGNLANGRHIIKLNASELTPGVYFFTVIAGETKLSQKMIVK